MFQDPTQAQNPFSVNADSDQNAYTNLQTQLGPNATLQKPGSLPSYQYPSYPNAYGLGSQNPNSTFGGNAPTSGPSGTAFASQPITVNTPDTSSRGSNPWSFLGEANSRDVPPPVRTGKES